MTMHQGRLHQFGFGKIIIANYPKINLISPEGQEYPAAAILLKNNSGPAGEVSTLVPDDHPEKITEDAYWTAPEDTVISFANADSLDFLMAYLLDLRMGIFPDFPSVDDLVLHLIEEHQRIFQPLPVSPKGDKGELK
jgi:hypothetical protein